jgi:hypothetical protein
MADIHGFERADFRGCCCVGGGCSFVSFRSDRDFEPRFKMRQHKLAVVTAHDMLLPYVPFFGREQPIVISRKGLGIGTRHAGRCPKGACINPGSRGRAQMAGERFFKGLIAVILRHGYLLS